MAFPVNEEKRVLAIYQYIYLIAQTSFGIEVLMFIVRHLPDANVAVCAGTKALFLIEE